MTLDHLAEAARCRVVAAATTNPPLQSRLYALGLYPGVEVSVLRFAPAGDPIQLRVGTTLLSIRKQEAAEIVIEEVI